MTIVVTLLQATPEPTILAVGSLTSRIPNRIN